MSKIILAPNPTGTGHNMRMLNIGRQLLKNNSNHELTVLLGSVQDIFTPLFQDAGINVVDLSPTGIIDYSVSSHLKKEFNWESMIKEYFVPTFFNGDKILRYINIFMKEKPDLIISDYNINASIAAILNRNKTVFVTERHNFTLVDVDEEDLINGGFDVNIKEISEAKKTLNSAFDWILSNTNLIITDKPYISRMDKGKLIEKYFESHKAHFVGPMYAARESAEFNINEWGIDPKKPYIVGTLSSTTMLKEDRDKNILVYLNVFRELKKKMKDLQLVLLGNINITPVKDVYIIPYLPNWTPLIENSLLLISHPGWITVTEVSKLNIPTLFYLPNFMEYHEVEAYRRLECLGIPVFVGEDIEKFADKIIKTVNTKEQNYSGYKILSPAEDGLEKAVLLIDNLL